MAKSSKTYRIPDPGIECTTPTSSECVRVGDFARLDRHSDFLRVVGVNRLERGVEIIRAAGVLEREHLSTHMEGDEIEIVMTRPHPEFGWKLYRVDHPRRSGVIAWVSIPEDEER